VPSTTEKIDRINLALSVLEAIENDAEHPALRERDAVRARRVETISDTTRRNNNQLDRNAIAQALRGLAANKSTQEIEAETGMPASTALVLFEAIDILNNRDDEEWST